MGASTTIANYLLPSVISDFKKINKKVRFHLLIGNTKRIVDHLNNGIITFGLVEGDVSKYKLRAEKVLKDELVVIVSPSHPYASRKNISVHDLAKEPFILREEGSGTRQVIEKYLLKYGISSSDLNVTAILGGTEAIKEAVEDGAGISIVSKWAVRREVSRGTLRMIPLKEERITRDFSLIHKNAVFNAATNEFLEYLKRYEYEKLFQRSR
jgi:DNA-binding transcriptional LysR family regulator